MKSGFIALIGKPNVGKSSLMNALIGEKVSIVSPKAQTTRDKILGIRNTEDYQMIFIDTPGVHKSKNVLGSYMAKCAASAADDVDALVVVLDATRQVLVQDMDFIEGFLGRGYPVIVAVNKTDLGGYEKVYPILSKLSPLMSGAPQKPALYDVVPVSAKTGENVGVLLEILEKLLPDGEKFFPDGDLTDKSERYMVCEMIREKALLYLQDEIPHGVGVVIQSMTEGDNITSIEADIICEKASHKQIVIGAGGEMLKTIGERARADIERMLGKKVYLKLFVKVRVGWRNRRGVLSDIGYDVKK